MYQKKYYLLFFCLILISCEGGEVSPENSSATLKNLPSNSNIPSPTPTSTITPIPTPIPVDPDPKPTPTPSLLPKIFSVFTNFDKKVDDFLSGYAQAYQGFSNFNIFNPAAFDDKIALLTYLGKSTEAGPGYSTQLESFKPDYFYGTYQTRIKTATCASSEEGVVSAFFLYFNDGKDYNKNTWADNIEIDVEILCAEPQTIYMSIWTDYQDDTHFIKNTRKVNLATGNYKQTMPGQEKQWGLNSSGSLPFALPAIKPNTQFVEIGFEWLENSVRFYLIDQGKEYQLWKYTNSDFIPHHPAYMMFNLWHNASHWHNDLPAQSPSKPVQMAIDYFAHEPK